MTILDVKGQSVIAVRHNTMPTALAAAVSSYDRQTRKTIHGNWARLTESERDEYRRFANSRFWLTRHRRCKQAADRLATMK